jgi:16S rRNA (guanine966-N2)-methyltransferase
MRIIAGSAKGRRLVGPQGMRTRPFTDRAKEALFSSLGAHVVEARVLDLYAGSGSLGLEALSRGAASATFVEQDREALVALEKNIAAVGRGGTVVTGDVARFLEGAGEGFDLAFVDPPYAESAATVDAVLLALAPHLGSGSIVVVHRRYGTEAPAAPRGMQLVDRRRYGDAELWRFVKEDG